MLGSSVEAELVGAPSAPTARSRRRAAPTIGLAIASSGVPPNTMMWRIDVGGAVGADVGELLGAHVRDRARQRRDHQREPLGDAARVDAGAVQRRRRPPRRRPPDRLAPWPGPGRTSRAASRRSCPTRRSADDLVVVRHQRRVDDAVGVQREDLLDAARRAPRRSARRRRSRRRPCRPCRPLCTQQPTSSRSGWREHALDRRPAHAAGRPLHDFDGACIGRSLLLVTGQIHPCRLTRVKCADPLLPSSVDSTCH